MIIKIIFQASNLLIFYKRTRENYPGCIVSYGISNCHDKRVYTIQRSEFVSDWDATKYHERVFELWEDK